MQCPNCGNVVSPSARFCGACGQPLTIASVPTASTSAAISGWTWGLLGLFGALAVLCILALGGLYLYFRQTGATLSFLQPEAPPVTPVLEPPVASGPVPVSGEYYCPDSRGIIVYWNAEYTCSNETGDAGYRQRIGDGIQELSNGQFDNQASSIKIPDGWSVMLWENPGQAGSHVCIETSTADLSSRGHFPGASIPIDGNVSSMEVFRDRTCGEDLAAGAEPAPWPADMRKPAGAAQDGQGAVDAAACNDKTPCGCIPPKWQDMLIGEDAPPPAYGNYPNVPYAIDMQKYTTQYDYEWWYEGEDGCFVKVEGLGYLVDELENQNIKMTFNVWFHDTGGGMHLKSGSGGTLDLREDCWRSPQDTSTLTCHYPCSGIKDYDFLIFDFRHETQNTFEQCVGLVIEPELPANDRCQYFENAKMDHVYGPWPLGAPLPVNFKMPEGVPWQEFDYKLRIGDEETEDCAPMEGNAKRLSCKITLPSEYAGTYNMFDLALYVDGCNDPIYTKGINEPLTLPGTDKDTKKAKDDEDESEPLVCRSNLPKGACEAAGGTWDDYGSGSCSCP